MIRQIGVCAPRHQSAPVMRCESWQDIFCIRLWNSVCASADMTYDMEAKLIRSPSNPCACHMTWYATESRKVCCYSFSLGRWSCACVFLRSGYMEGAYACMSQCLHMEMFAWTGDTSSSNEQSDNTHMDVYMTTPLAACTNGPSTRRYARIHARRPSAGRRPVHWWN
jgi:hypothetical protein